MNVPPAMPVTMAPARSAPETRVALAEDLEEASRVLAAAFRDNPLNVAVIGADPERRLRCNLAGMQQLLPVARQHGLVLCAHAKSLLGALIATAPHGYPLPPPPLGAQLRALFAQGLSVRMRWGQVFAQLNRVHPREPHWYLATLGVEPGSQHQGAGRALLESLLERCERDALPCYLETDRQENVAFYGSAGFSVCQESRVVGVPVWHMRRPPRPA